jgi:hypothetical protein
MPQQRPPQYKQFEPRRRHPVRRALLALAVAGGVAGAGAAVVTSFGDEVGGSAEAPPESTASTAPTVPRAPRTVSAGKPFTIGRHQVLAGWTVREEFGMFTVAARVKNVSDMNSTAFLQVRFLKGTEILAGVQCASDDLEPGRSGPLVCVPDGLYTKSYDRITAEPTS